MVDDTTICIHDLLAAGRLHQARDVVCRLLRDIEQAMIRGEAADECMQALQGGRCVHVPRPAADVWG